MSRVGFPGFFDFLLSAVVSLPLQGKFSLVFGNRFRLSGFCGFLQCRLFLFLNLCGSLALFLLLPQLLGFNGGNPFFLGNRFNRGIVAADEIEVNVDVLLTVDGSTARSLMDFHSVNKGVEHGIRQFFVVPIFPDKSDEAGCVHLLDLVLLNQTFQLCNTLFQHKLFFIVLLNHALCLSLRQQTVYGAFIQLIDFFI